MKNSAIFHPAIGIVGAGDIVRDVHLPCLLARDDVYVNWITDINYEEAKEVADAFKVKSYKLPTDLKDLPSADIVLLAVPYGAREYYYQILRERSSALYVEKPFARTVEYHRQICSWFPPHRLACGFQRRAFGPIATVKQLIGNKLFGELVQINYGFGQPGIITGGKYYSNIQIAGGGILFDFAIHGIDALLYCTGAKATDLKYVKMIMDKGFDLHTEAEFLIRTGKKETIPCKITVSWLQETIRSLEFIFEKAIASVTFSSGEVRIRPLTGLDSYILHSSPGNLFPVTAYQTFHIFWSQFLKGLEAQEENWTSASQSLITTELIEDLYAAGKRSNGF